MTENTKVLAAVLQMNSTEDVAANVASALALVEEAVLWGAELLVLPEKFHYLGGAKGAVAASEPLDGALVTSLSETAARHGIFLLAGSIWEEIEGDHRAYNTSVLLGPDGQQIAVYRKIHMFDVDVGGHSYRESDDCCPGSQVVTAQMNAGLKVGMSVCYDLRFPELYRKMVAAGARIFTVPAAFTMATGRDHWEVLLRARAVENQVFVVAANQVGRNGEGLESYGRSMIVDPWGIVLAQVGDGEGIAVAELDLLNLEQVRANLPALNHPVLYHSSSNSGPLSLRLFRSAGRASPGIPSHDRTYEPPRSRSLRPDGP